MTTLYKFKAYYTDAGVGTAQDPAPTCTVINMADDSKLADAQATTASTNMPGLYSYEYSGADGLDCVAFFATTDTGCDVKQLASYVSEKITTNLNADVSGLATQASVNAIPTTPLLAANYVAPDNASIAAILEDTGTTIPATLAGLATSAEVGAIALLGETVIGTYTVQDILKILAAKMVGKATGGGTATITYRGVDDTSDVIIETVDSNGNRSAVTLTV